MEDSIPFPRPTCSPAQTVLALEKLRYNPTNDLIFPSVVKVSGRVANPLGAYYLYYAPHDAPGGICLAYANAPEGPWIEFEQNPLVAKTWKPHYDVSHISSPHVLWMEERQRFFLYFHGENDTTRVASSADGVHFEYEGIAVTTKMYRRITESSYARVFPCISGPERTRYLMLFMGNNDGTRRIYAAWSRDGLSFEPQMKPLVSPPPGTGVSQVGGPWFWRWQGRNYILFHGDKTPPDLSNLTSDIYIAEVGETFEEENHLGVFYPRENASPENKRAADPCLFHENGADWLFLSIGPRLNQSLAQARLV